MTDPIDCAYSVEGDGPPLFLIHGIGAARDAWARAMPLLTRHFTVVRYDLRGHGESPLPHKPFGLDELVADLEALRARLGYARAHFAGHSLGGMIAPAYARAFPGRVISLGLLSTAAFRSSDDRNKVLAVIAAMEERGIGNVLATLTGRWFTDDFISRHGDVVARRLAQVMATDAEVFLNVFRVYAETEMSPWLHEIAAPALVLTGENDGGCNPRLNKQIAEAMPGAELVILPGYKHSILLEAGEVVARHLVDYIKRV